MTSKDNYYFKMCEMEVLLHLMNWEILSQPVDVYIFKLDRKNAHTMIGGSFLLPLTSLQLS